MKILNRKIHWFNPGHEDAIRTNSPHYTPPASVCRMMTDLALLPLWYSNENDYVIINEASESSRFLLALPANIRPAAIPVLPSEFNSAFPVEATPWGLSPQSIQFFETHFAQNENIIIPPWKEKYKELTGRQTALACLSKIQNFLPGFFDSLILPQFCSTIDEIRTCLDTYPPPYMLKTPFSCSGRGLYRLPTCDLDMQTTRWIHGALRKQGIISIEQNLDKVCDFAMEFESDGNGHIHFKGLAVFNTQSKGTYSGNLLGSQSFIEKYLSDFIPISYLLTIQETLTTILSEVLGYDYQGYLGVDMMVYRRENTFAIHPMVEINLRNTMGLVALQISNRLIHTSSHGQLIISFNKDKNTTYNAHLQMQKDYPLQLSASKIQSGYLSLCPVTPETQYLAYMMVVQSEVVHKKSLLNVDFQDPLHHRIDISEGSLHKGARNHAGAGIL